MEVNRAAAAAPAACAPWVAFAEQVAFVEEAACAGRLVSADPEAAARNPVLAVDPDQWLNLIHVEDGVRAVLAAEERAKSGETYLVADGTPVRRWEFYTHLARLLGAPEPRYAPPEGRDGNRRVSNAKARAELGFVPAFPSYIEGLNASRQSRPGAF